MRCPFCQCADTKVTDSRATDDGKAIRRRRECQQCGRRFTTYEIDEVAYIRFASVYREFADLDSFMAELQHLMGTKEKK